MRLERPFPLNSPTSCSHGPPCLQLERTLNIAECPPSTHKGLALNVTSPTFNLLTETEIQSLTGLLASIRTAAHAGTATGETRMPPPPHQEGAATAAALRTPTAAAASPCRRLPAGLLFGRNTQNYKTVCLPCLPDSPGPPRRVHPCPPARANMPGS